MKATAFLTIATASSLVAPAAEAPPTKTNVAASAEINGFADRMFMSFSGSIDGQAVKGTACVKNVMKERTIR